MHLLLLLQQVVLLRPNQGWDNNLHPDIFKTISFKKWFYFGGKATVWKSHKTHFFFSSSLILPTFSTPALWRYQEWHLEFRAEVSPTFPTKVLVAHYEETITKVSTFLKLVFPPQKWQSLMGGAVLQTAPFIILQALPISFFFLVSFSNLPGIWFSCLLWWSKCKAKQFWKRPADFGISQLEAQ